MKSPHVLGIALLLSAALTHACAAAGATKDDAGQSVYAGGWNESAGVAGFGDWKFQEYKGASDSYAGHFIADNATNPEMGNFGASGKAFGLYANGVEFESAAAFRSFATALKSGDAFSFRMMNVLIEQKGSKDSDAAGSIGLTLRAGNASDATDDYNKGARFEIINLKGEPNYQVYDGESSHDSGVVYSDQGIAVTVTLTGADTYDLDITRLADKKATKLSGRKLGGAGSIESFCIFDRNGEKADGFFNDFEVSAAGK